MDSRAPAHSVLYLSKYLHSILSSRNIIEKKKCILYITGVVMTCVLLPAVRSGIPGVCHTFGIFPDGGKLEMSTSLEDPG